MLEPIADADDGDAPVERMYGCGRDDGVDARSWSAADEDAETLGCAHVSGFSWRRAALSNPRRIDVRFARRRLRWSALRRPRAAVAKIFTRDQKIRSNPTDLVVSLPLVKIF